MAILPDSAVIFAVTETFRALKMIEPLLLAEIGLETVMALLEVVKLRQEPLMNETALATLIVPVPVVEFVKFTVRLLLKLFPPEFRKERLVPELAALFCSRMFVSVPISLPMVRVFVVLPVSPVPSFPENVPEVVSV